MFYWEYESYYTKASYGYGVTPTYTLEVTFD